MNITESGAGTSCKERENGDASNGSERPLKKARFAWQVKGKYHLKNDASDVAKSSNAEPPEPDEAGSSGSGGSSNIATEQNLDMLGDYLLKQDYSPLDSVITDSDKSLLKPSTSISTDKLQYPRYVSSYENVTSNVLKRTMGSNHNVNNEMDSLPMSMVVSQNFSEDQCIARWQARQMAKGFVDNTINRVLDSWIEVQVPAEENDSRFLALDVADFINNLPSDNSIENEGILMAISAHGLQNTSNSSSNNSNTGETEEEERTEASKVTKHSPSPARSLSPFSSDDESHESNNNHCGKSNDLDMGWTYPVEQKNDIDNLSSFPLFPDSSSLSYQYMNDNQNTNSECEQNDHCDFLDAAVLFAIQSKGLTTFGTDYG